MSLLLALDMEIDVKIHQHGPAPISSDAMPCSVRNATTDAERMSRFSQGIPRSRENDTFQDCPCRRF
jgi:hypothetical protein